MTTTTPPPDACAPADDGRAKIYALIEEMQNYEHAVANGEEISEEIKLRMLPQPGAGVELVRAMRDIQEYAVRTGLSEMTDEEINAEIAAARRERRARKQAAAQWHNLHNAGCH